jgi:small GTP-binding protein
MGMREFKLVLLGGSGVGKSCLFQRLLTGEFNSLNESTLGAAFAIIYLAEYEDGQLAIVKTSQLQDAACMAKQIWKIEAWDTAGQERFRGLLPMYYRNANVAIVVHDGTPSSVETAKRHRQELVSDWKTSTQVLALFQNKCDIEGFSYRRDLARDEAFEVAGFVSARTGENVMSLFLRVCRKYIEMYNRDIPEPHDALLTPTIRIHEEHDSPYVSCCAGYSH